MRTRLTYRPSSRPTHSTPHTSCGYWYDATGIKTLTKLEGIERFAWLVNLLSIPTVMCLLTFSCSDPTLERPPEHALDPIFQKETGDEPYDTEDAIILVLVKSRATTPLPQMVLIPASRSDHERPREGERNARSSFEPPSCVGC